MSELERAWSWREERGILRETEAVRVFHGPGEGTGSLSRVMIDRFGAHFWVTERESNTASSEDVADRVREFLVKKGAVSAVALWRPKKGMPEEPVALLGEPPPGKVEVSERGAKFLIQLKSARHPGLFLDHAPLRLWLRSRAQGWNVLNAFAYTGSLSVSAGLGGAAQVTTLDLSKATLDWASENWKCNGLRESSGRFIAGDVFEWFPRLAREGSRYDCVILDPPSFSRGKKGSFSTFKDLSRLHDLAFRILAPGGFLVSSINSANVSRRKFETDVLDAARRAKMRLELISEISLPETFPTRFGEDAERYLKGFILRRAL